MASLALAGAHEGLLATVLGTVAVACAMANVVGGFLIAMYLPIFSIAGAIK